MSGKKEWFLVDGYRPPLSKGGTHAYEGHECIMILNCNEEDAHIKMDVYFMDREPVKDICYTAKARRISAFRSDDKTVFGGLNLGIGEQYSLQLSSDIGVIVQYGRMDINQDNLAYMAFLGHAE